MKQYENTQAIASDFFFSNRKKLAQKLPKTGIAALLANNQYIRNGDVLHKYRQDSNLYYLTGIEQEQTILLLNAKAETKLFITRPEPNMETWTGKRLTKEEATAISGIEQVYFLEELEPVLAVEIPEYQSIHLAIDIDADPVPTDIMSASELFYGTYIEDEYSIELASLLDPLKELRWIKSALEIKHIQESVTVTCEAFNRVLKTVKPEIKEYEIEAEISYAFNKKGANHAFHPIVASGTNACTLHYETNQDTCQDGDLLLLDFGADLNYYAADISRTVPVNGRFTPRQKECYQAVLEVQKQAIKLIQVGNTVDAINQEVAKLMEQKMVELGLFNQEELAAQNPDNPLYFKYYMHGASHSMGLDVHDIGFRDKTMPLQPGCVLTCEPGLYIPEEGIGIRIEDDILVTAEGNVNLTESIPKEIAELEILLAKK